MTPKIYHNPKCSTSRNALAIMIASGETPEVVEYLKTPPSKAELTALIEQMPATPQDIIRSKESLYTELGLDKEGVTDEQLIDAMIANPILINRPIVVTDKGVALCRPLERVFDLLDNPISHFTKENGDEITYNKG